MLIAWAVFAASQEATPYLFPGLRRGFGAGGAELAHVASAFPLGCAVGAAVASVMVDMVGRRATMVVATPAAGALHVCMAFAGTLGSLVVFRFLQSVAFGMAMTATVAWYVEFLPTQHRGPLLAAYSAGWPLGRAAVILTATLTGDSWQWLLLVGAGGFAAMTALTLCAMESPRFLLARGREQDALDVLQGMHASNGSQQSFNRGARLCLTEHGKEELLPQGAGQCFATLVRVHWKLLAYSLTLFGVLSATTVVIDTWGPGVFQNLVTPGGHELPHNVLQCFNFGDLAGIVSSVFFADRIGRRGSFVIGFFVQGLLYAALALVALAGGGASAVPLVVALGTAAAACRCFAWEAAHFWTLEAFTTDVRGMAFGLATGAMRLFSVASLEVSGAYAGGLEPGTALGLFALSLGVGGVVALLFFPMETANRPMAEGSCAHPERHCKA